MNHNNNHTPRAKQPVNQHKFHNSIDCVPELVETNAIYSFFVHIINGIIAHTTCKHKKQKRKKDG